MEFAIDYDVRSETDFALHRIKLAIPLPEYRLRLTFEDGISGEVDMNPIIKRGGVFRELVNPERFSQVQIAPSGRYLFWPDEVDMDADALYIQIRHNIIKSDEESS